MGVDFCDQVMTTFLNSKISPLERRSTSEQKKPNKLIGHQHKTGLSRRNFKCRLPLVLDHWY